MRGIIGGALVAWLCSCSGPTAPEPAPPPPQPVVTQPPPPDAAPPDPCGDQRPAVAHALASKQIATAADARTVKSLTLTSADQLDGVTCFPVLNRLVMSGASLDRVPDLRDLHALAHLDLSNNRIADLEPLAELAQLRSLLIGGNPFTDISPLTRLDKGARIGIYPGKICDVSKLLEAGLEVDQPGPEDQCRCDALQPYPVTGVDCTAMNPLVAAAVDSGAIGCAASAFRTTSLTVNKPTLASLRGIQCLPALTRLDLSGTAVRDLRPLEAVPNLRELSLEATPVRDLSPLRELPQLTTLDLTRTGLRSVRGLRKLTGLRRLYLAENKISSVSALAGMKALERLDLANNRLTDVRALVPLIRTGVLARVELEGNQIEYRRELELLRLLGSNLADQQLGSCARALRRLPAFQSAQPQRKPHAVCAAGDDATVRRRLTVKPRCEGSAHLHEVCGGLLAFTCDGDLGDERIYLASGTGAELARCDAGDDCAPREHQCGPPRKPRLQVRVLATAPGDDTYRLNHHFDRRRSELLRCYLLAWSANQTLRGVLDVGFRIDANGHASDFSVATDDTGIASCVTDTISRMTLPGLHHGRLQLDLGY